jgi:hypothetical protein
MDQLKEIWKYVVKYHFWILTSIVLLTSLFVFSSSRGALDQQVSSRYSALDSAFSAVSQLEQSAPTHANDGTKEKMDAMLNEVRSNVYDAWTKQYERQVPILKWSSDIFDEDSEPIRIVDGFRPIELFLEFPPPVVEPLSKTQREVYRDYVKNEFNDLAKIIGSVWSAELGGAGRSADTAGATTTINPLVIWNPASQEALQQSVASWWDAAKVPTTLEICYTQEDIWILSAILQVIQKTNGTARENFQAPIKEILSIKIGKTASEGTFIASGPASPAGVAEPGLATDGVSTYGMSDPADQRYVDANYRPVPGSELRTRIKGDSVEDAFFAVAKRVPIRLRVRMEQAKLAKLLAECGNGGIMIEVKQVRINTGEQPLALTLGSGQAVGGEDGGESSGGFGGGFSAAHSSYGVTSTGDGEPNIPVEIYGIVHLFNPPNKQKLGFPAESTEDATGGNL